MALLAVVGNPARCGRCSTLVAYNAPDDWACNGCGAQSNPPVIKATSGRPITMADYPGVFQDTDHDAIPDVDDPQPHVPGHDTVEEVRLSDEIRELIDLRQDYDVMRRQLVDRLQAFAPHGEIKSRTKTPYSILNKLRRKRLTGAKGITDLVGAMLVVHDRAELERVVAQIKAGALGPVLEHEDLYAQPRDGYRAHHFVLSVDGKPAELQIKTHRMKEIAAAAHHAYKTGRLDGSTMFELTELADAADRGDAQAASTIDFYLQDEAQLEGLLTRKLNPPWRNPPGRPEDWRDPSASEREQRVYEAQLLAMRYATEKADRELARRMPRDRRERGAANPGTDVLDVYTGERRFYPTSPVEAVVAAAGQPATELGDFVRAGSWVAKLGGRRRNPNDESKRVGNFWYQLLDTVHHAIYDLAGQQGGRGVATIYREQWLQLFPRIKPGGGKVNLASAEQAWYRLRERIQAEDAQGAGLEALSEGPGVLHLNVANVFDAAWRAMPGKHHQRGEVRERELLVAEKKRTRGAPAGKARAKARSKASQQLVDSSGYYQELDAEIDPHGEEIPGGSMEAYEARKRMIRGEGQLAVPTRAGSLVGRANHRHGPGKEPRGKPPKVERVTLEEAIRRHPHAKKALLAQARKKVREFHGRKAQGDMVDLYYLPDGAKKETWGDFHAGLHHTIETPYVVKEKDSNKAGKAGKEQVWIHEHEEGGEPFEVWDPRLGITKKILNRAVVGEWWFS